MKAQQDYAYVTLNGTCLVCNKKGIVTQLEEDNTATRLEEDNTVRDMEMYGYIGIAIGLFLFIVVCMSIGSASVVSSLDPRNVFASVADMEE